MRTYVRRAENRQPQPSGPKQFGRTVWFGVPDWVDPFWWIQGSEPEKMVMDAFVRLGIYFEHTPQTNPVHWSPLLVKVAHSDPRDWEPDFLLPQYKIWLEVNGTHFHTLPGAMDRDAFRGAIIQEAGWKYIAWWDYEIEKNLWGLINSVPEFRDIKVKDNRGRRRNVEGKFWEGMLKNEVDHLAGLRTANRNRAKPPQHMEMRWRRSYTRKPK